MTLILPYMSGTYLWHRLWCPREGNFRLSHDGFLEDVGKRYRAFTEVRAFEEIAETPILILLGEPGIGKTSAIVAERQAIEALASEKAERIAWPELQGIGSEEGFVRAVVDTPEFQEWVRGEAVLHLYLDALDECMLRVRTLGRLLIRSLDRGPRERLSLRLTCRTAQWSNELENDLRRLFDTERVKAFELLPLTKRDATTAVEANGIDAAAFFDYVRRTGAAALASRPVPLDFLIRCFRTGKLPATQVQLYEEGCLMLCEESEHRTETGLEAELTAERRLSVAKRVAAAMVFSARATILLGREDAETPVDALRVREVAGGTERAGFSTFDVSEAGIRDALDTGLFTSRGAKILGWAHHTYQEYLAARYTSDSSLTAAQILPLIVHPDDVDRKLTPQLHGVASWLSSLRPEIFEYIADHEPELLLMSDVVIENPRDRARVVDALLKRRAACQLARIDVLELHKLHKLAHPDIATQLRPHLSNRSAAEDIRRFAADIAEYTACSGLISELTTIALDNTEPIELRVDAATAVVRIGTPEERAALTPLLDGPGGTRQEKWLIRLALKAAWPHAISAGDLFQTLSGQRRRLGSATDDFTLAEHVSDTLREHDMPVALAWVLARVRSTPEGRSFHFRDALQRLENAIIQQAWTFGGTLMAPLAEIALEKIRRYEPLLPKDDDEHDFNAQLAINTGHRRELAEVILTTAARAEPPVRAWQLFQDTAFLRTDDLDWLLDRQRPESRAEVDEAFDAEVILRLADLTNPAIFQLLYDVATHNAALAARLESICAAIALDSNEAEYLREEYAAVQDLARERTDAQKKRARQRRPIPNEEWLMEAERNPAAFWRLLDAMSLDVDDDYLDRMNLDVLAFPGWLEADDAMRRRVVVIAERFLRESDPAADEWFGSQEFTLSAVGGARALFLLQKEAPAVFSRLGADVWRTWTPALLGIPNNDRHVPLLAEAYLHAPDEVVHRLQQLVRGSNPHVVYKLDDVLDDTLASAIIDVLKEGVVSAETLAMVLEQLLRTAVAQHFAIDLVQRNEDSSLAMTAAAYLLLYAPNAAWPVIWRAFAEDGDFGRGVVERAVKRDHFEGRPVYVLEESHVADLYLWLCREYPPSDDPVHDGVFAPGTRDNIASWRSRCLDALKHRGTKAACAALRRLVDALPDQTYLPPLVVEAEAIRRAKSWEPTSVSTLRQLLVDTSRRQVRSETELADVISESLSRLQKHLQGETPAAFDLWNTAPMMKPKSENEFTDYVARHLRRDLAERDVIIGREVEIRRTASPGSGERTDIHVDVMQEGNRSSVIVETKGCWNPGLLLEQRVQLANRYLRENQTRTGIYLVGWFACAVWDDEDYRKTACRAHREDMERQLAADAADLRTEGYDIRPVVLDCTLR